MGQRVRNRSAIWLKSSNQVVHVSILSIPSSNHIPPTLFELASFNPFITGYWVSYVICNQFRRWANIPSASFQVQQAQNEECFIGLKSKSSQQLVPSLSESVSPMTPINQSRSHWFYGRAGAKKVNLVEERSQAKMPRKANQCAKPKSTPGGQWQSSSLRITRITGWPMT